MDVLHGPDRRRENGYNNLNLRCNKDEVEQMDRSTDLKLSNFTTVVIFFSSFPLELNADAA